MGPLTKFGCLINEILLDPLSRLQPWDCNSNHVSTLIGTNKSFGLAPGGGESIRQGLLWENLEVALNLVSGEEPLGLHDACSSRLQTSVILENSHVKPESDPDATVSQSFSSETIQI